MRYLIRNTNTNVIEMVFQTPVTPSPPMEVIQVPDNQWRGPMLNSIFVDVNNYKPYPAPEGSSADETYWVSDGTNWTDPRADDEVWEYVTKRRNEELSNSDWTQLDDSPLNPPDKGLWTAYRNQLRNIPNANPNNPRAAQSALEAVIANDKPQVGRGRNT